MVHGDQKVVQECYKSSLEMIKEHITEDDAPLPDTQKVDDASWYPMLGVDNEKLTST